MIYLFECLLAIDEVNNIRNPCGIPSKKVCDMNKAFVIIFSILPRFVETDDVNLNRVQIYVLIFVWQTIFHHTSYENIK